MVRVSKSFADVRVLSNISFDLASGELVALTGPSGCGKTTLLQIMGALDRPDSGSVRVDDVALDRLDDPARFRRETVGFVFQLHNLLPMLTAEANVAVPMIPAGVPRDERARRARQLLAEVGLAGREEHRPAELSGGERQRVAVARALANRPRFLLADEPTGALDSKTSEQIMDLLTEVHREGVTVVIVTHEAAVAATRSAVTAPAS